MKPAAAHGLRFKVLLAAGAAMALVVLATAGAASWLAMQQQGLALQSRNEAVAESLAVQLERILALGIPLAELQGFDVQCDEAVNRHGGLSFALVLDAGGQPLFRSARANSPLPLLPPPDRLTGPAPALLTPDGNTQLAVVPVQASRTATAAWAVVGFSRGALEAERNALLLRALGAGAVVLLLALAVMYGVVARVLLRPLSRVATAVDRVRQHGASPQLALPVRGSDEFTVLSAGFNGLLQTVAAREQELRAARDTAESASSAKSQFLAVMSHELRTPLNAVLGMAELLGNTPLDARQRRHVDQVRAAGRTLAALIGDVLDLSRIEAGHLAVTLAPFSLRGMVDEAVGLFEDDARRRGLQLLVQVDAVLADRVQGDALRTRQILVNLLSNAMKFTRRGQVAVSVAPTEEGVRFAVADTGEGIDPAVLPYIYDAFRQGDGSSTRHFGGAGLGLTIARHLCQLLGGHIDVASRHGQGSTFWFELPLQMAAPAVPRRPDMPPPPAAVPAGPAVLALPAGLRVLLIEDDSDGRDLVQQHLAGAGLVLTTGSDGLAGIALLREQPYDVVLLDWQLPGIDGLAVLAMLRALEDATGRPRAQVIAVTAHAGVGDRDTCLAAGADDFLAKPFDGASLLAHLAAASRRLGAQPAGL
jgi:signal transduction histidine kinase/ActR/RegA family two-component response regulator